MTVKIDASWKENLEDEFEKQYFKDLVDFVKEEYSSTIIYPPPKKIFAAFDATPFEEVKVIILGQDPYHGPNQANGLCFSVNEGVKNPPSLENIYKEILNDTGERSQTNGDLSSWAKQGVLLLNATLTVRKSSPGSHQNKGWEQFTDAVIKRLSDIRKNLVFILWGAYAQKKGEIINTNNGHLILKSAHPSPFSANRGFFGNKHFTKANDYLIKNGFKPIIW